MSTHHTHNNHNPIPKTPLVRKMRPRSPDEVHRASTPLELFFDLVFVVAVALAAARLHHGIVENHIGHALLSFCMVFFAIWWAWMGFSWFASAYDTDDVPYRLLVLLQLLGALIFAAGVPAAFENSDFRVGVTGYIIMRIALVLQWSRAWRADPSRRRTIGYYIIGLLIVQTAWFVLVFVDGAFSLIGFAVLALLDMGTPLFAEMKGDKQTPWHPEHIVERYGLFTIIVLGESILSASMAIQAAISAGALSDSLIQIILGGVLIVFSMWWVYFQQTEHHIEKGNTAFYWGYGHYFIFASVAAVGAGLAASVDAADGHAAASRVLINAAVIVPVIIFNLSVGIVHGRLRSNDLVVWSSFLLAMALMFAAIWSDFAVLLTGLIMATLLGFKLWLNRGNQDEVHH